MTDEDVDHVIKGRHTPEREIGLRVAFVTPPLHEAHVVMLWT